MEKCPKATEITQRPHKEDDDEALRVTRILNSSWIQKATARADHSKAQNLDLGL